MGTVAGGSPMNQADSTAAGDEIEVLLMQNFEADDLDTRKVHQYPMTMTSKVPLDQFDRHFEDDLHGHIPCA